MAIPEAEAAAQRDFEATIRRVNDGLGPLVEGWNAFQAALGTAAQEWLARNEATFRAISDLAGHPQVRAMVTARRAEDRNATERFRTFDGATLAELEEFIRDLREHGAPDDAHPRLKLDENNEVIGFTCVTQRA